MKQPLSQNYQSRGGFFQITKNITELTLNVSNTFLFIHIIISDL